VKVTVFDVEERNFDPHGKGTGITVSVVLVAVIPGVGVADGVGVGDGVGVALGVGWVGVTLLDSCAYHLRCEGWSVLLR
jgi:hypothetical protein